MTTFLKIYDFIIGSFLLFQLDTLFLYDNVFIRTLTVKLLQK